MISTSYLVIVSDSRVQIMIDDRPYVLIRPPAWAINDGCDDARVSRKLETGRAVIYTDNGQEVVLFDSEIDEVKDSLSIDGIEDEEVSKMEMESIDVAWFS